MTQTVVQSGTDFFANTTTASVTLPGVVAGNAIEVRVAIYGNNPAAQGSPSDGVNTYALAARQGTAVSGTATAEIHYAENVAGGNTTVTVTTNAPADYRYGWIWVGEIAGRATSGSLDSAATGTATATSNSPAVTGAGSTTVANTMLSAVFATGSSTANAGIDAANGNSLTWSNRILKQDANAEMAMSGDDAPATSTLTPSVNWGTLAGSYKWAAVVVAFKDAEGGTTYDETITESAAAGESNAAAAVANAAQAESAGAGESNAAAATLNPAVAESVLAVDDQGATTEINPSLIESAGAGDSYADDGSSTYNETITESATAGDSYETDAPANLPTGGSTRRPRRQIRPEELDPAEFDLYLLEVGQSFAITFAAGATVDMAAEQAQQFDYGLGWEAGAEVGLEFLQRASMIEFAATAQPLRAKAAPVQQRTPVARVRLSMEQDPGELEIELA